MVEYNLWVSAYTLIGVFVYINSVKHFRKREWLTYGDLFAILLPFLIIWPVGLGFILFGKIKDSEFSYKILKLINGR